MQLSRRFFLGGLVAAPAVIAINKLMPVKSFFIPQVQVITPKWIRLRLNPYTGDWLEIPDHALDPCLRNAEMVEYDSRDNSFKAVPEERLYLLNIGDQTIPEVLKVYGGVAHAA